MAFRLAFHYHPRSSPVHRLDARTKLFLLFLITSNLISFHPAVFTAASIALAGIIFWARLPWKLPGSTLLAWSPLIVLVFLVQSFSFETALHFHKLSDLFPSTALLEAGVTCWRIVLMILYAVVFTAVTRPGDLQQALFWLFRPFSFLPARRIAVMVRLTFHFFVLLLDDANAIALAHKARGGRSIRNPFRLLKTLAMPLVRKGFLRTETTALALAARGYRDDVPMDIPPWPRGQIGWIVVTALAFHGLRHTSF